MLTFQSSSDLSCGSIGLPLLGGESEEILKTVHCYCVWSRPDQQQFVKERLVYSEIVTGDQQEGMDGSSIWLC